MNDSDLKARILEAAASLFCESGFHGTSMRDIAAGASCSLPMMYYYFSSKNELYEEIAVNQFFELIKRLNSELDLSRHPIDLYLQVAKQRRDLKGFGRAVMKVAYKLWYGFEGSAELRAKITEWERDRVANTRRVMDRFVPNEADRQAFAEVFTNYFESIITKIVMLEEDIPEEAIRRQLEFLTSKISQ